MSQSSTGLSKYERASAKHLAIASEADDPLVPDPQVLERYGITAMTLWRWDRDPELGFPKPIYIRLRKYRRLSQLVAWERQRARASRRDHGLAARDRRRIAARGGSPKGSS
jgi:hypothetical protein